MTRDDVVRQLVDSLTNLKIVISAQQDEEVPKSDNHHIVLPWRDWNQIYESLCLLDHFPRMAR